MSLYDDLDADVGKQAPDWSSGFNRLIPQTQLQIKHKIQQKQIAPKKPPMKVLKLGISILPRH